MIVVTPASAVEVRSWVRVPITISEVSLPTLMVTPLIVTGGPPAVMVVAPTTICVVRSVVVIENVEGRGRGVGAGEVEAGEFGELGAGEGEGAGLAVVVGGGVCAVLEAAGGEDAG